jgi:hypothetical protein
MRFFADDLGNTVRVQWYFVPPTNKVMPFYHPFGARIDIIRDSQTLVLGEDVTTIREHEAGLVRRGPGVTFCGSQRMWTQGASVLDPIPPANVLTGLPCCCGPGIMQDSGGGVGASGPEGFLLQEDLWDILQEDSGRILVT